SLTRIKPTIARRPADSASIIDGPARSPGAPWLLRAGSRQALVEDRQGECDLVGGSYEWRDDPDHVHVRARGQDDQLSLEGLRLDPLGQLRIGGAPIADARLDELEREHQAE